MPRRHRLPIIWLFTDERMGEALWPALSRLPKGKAGVIFRHDHAPDRLRLAARVGAVAKARRLVFIVAGRPGDALRWHADGVHLRAPARLVRSARRFILTASAHGLADLVAARRARVDLAFLSPLHTTRSHAGARSLGRVRFGLLLHGTPVPIAALGGMTKHRFRAVHALGAAGWGAIDVWNEGARESARR